MRKIRKENKKAVSEVVSYVLLIVVAISLSIIVYAWIKIQLPKEIIECPEGVSVIIKDYRCNKQNNIINITFKNNGFYIILFVALVVFDNNRHPFRAFYYFFWKLDLYPGIYNDAQTYCNHD